MNFRKKNACCKQLERLLPQNAFKALTDPTRVRILAALASGGREHRVSEAARYCSVDLSVVSRHLQILKNAGILVAEKRGKEVFYKVRTEELVTLLRQLADSLEACCPSVTGVRSGVKE
jgi:ArsR family transcriptional regulator